MEEGLARSLEKYARNTASGASVAASGIEPPVRSFYVQRMSGDIPACSQANIVPMRPSRSSPRRL